MKLITLSIDWSKLTLVTDCKFWYDMLYEHMPTWNDEKFESKENTDMTKKMWKLLQESRLPPVY